MYLPFDQDWNDLDRGHYLSRDIALTRRPQADTRTEVFSIRPSLEWPEEGPLFESDSNKRRGANTRPLIYAQTITEVKPGALGQILHPPGDHKSDT